MGETSYKNIDDDTLVEDAYRFQYSEKGKPEVGDLPKVYDILSEIELPTHAPYFVQYLQGGFMLGMGWKLGETSYDHALLARLDAFQKCGADGTPARVLIKLARIEKLQVVCIFFQEKGKTFVAIPSDDGRILKQEIIDQFGGEITLEELEDFERNLGTKETFGRVGY